MAYEPYKTTITCSGSAGFTVEIPFEIIFGETVLALKQRILLKIQESLREKGLSDSARLLKANDLELSVNDFPIKDEKIESKLLNLSVIMFKIKFNTPLLPITPITPSQQSAPQEKITVTGLKERDIEGLSQQPWSKLSEEIKKAITFRTFAVRRGYPDIETLVAKNEQLMSSRITAEDYWNRVLSSKYHRVLLESLLPKSFNAAPTQPALTQYNLEEKDENGIPFCFLCPISLEIMRDPVIAADGQIYEKSVIENWFVRCQRNGKGISSPLNGDYMPSANLIPKKDLKSIIDIWVKTKGSSAPANAATQCEPILAALPILPTDSSIPRERVFYFKSEQISILQHLFKEAQIENPPSISDGDLLKIPEETFKQQKNLRFCIDAAGGREVYNEQMEISFDSKVTWGSLNKFQDEVLGEYITKDSWWDKVITRMTNTATITIPANALDIGILSVIRGHLKIYNGSLIDSTTKREDLTGKIGYLLSPVGGGFFSFTRIDESLIEPSISKNTPSGHKS